MFTDKEISKFISKIDCSQVGFSLLLVEIFYTIFIYLAFFSNMFAKKILILNPEYLSSSPQVATEWMISVIEPIVPTIKVFIALFFITLLFLIVGTYQQYQLLRFRRYIKKIKISVIR